MSSDVAHHPAVEEYLETIYHLEETQVPAMRARLVERLHVSAPAVSDQVRRLEREGYLVMGSDRTLALTPSGREYATAIVRRHRLAERLLVDVLGLPWHQVHAEAGRLEHAISPVLEARLVDLLGDPATCPHGNLIPGSAQVLDPGPLMALPQVAPGSQVELVRIEEELQADTAVLEVMEAAGALPGARLTVRSSGPAGVEVAGPAGELTVDLRSASAILVRAAGPTPPTS